MSTVVDSSKAPPISPPAAGLRSDLQNELRDGLRNDLRNVLPNDLREVTPPILELEGCNQPDCACRGLGAITLLAAGSQTQLEAHARHLASQGTCLLRQKAAPGTATHPNSAAVQTSLYYQGHLLCAIACSQHSVSRESVSAATATLDLPTLRQGSFRIHTSSQDQFLLLHQPPSLSPLERQIQQALPRELPGSPGSVLSQNGLLLLLQPGGGALGDFLAKAALLRQRERWQAQTSKPPGSAT